MLASEIVCGKYFGLKKVRQGREDELSPKERRDLNRAKPDLDLEIRCNGTFKRQITEGTWRVRGDRVLFEPDTFGGESLIAMKHRTESMGRVFTLAFVFHAFELIVEGTSLVSPDVTSIIITEYRQNW